MNGITEQFELFFQKIDTEVEQLINPLPKKGLTNKISKIHGTLWAKEKLLKGNSTGLYGISEYIVFSVFRTFIKMQNKSIFCPSKIESDKDENLRKFVLEKNGKKIIIYNNCSTIHYPPELFNNGLKAVPDVAILRQDENGFHLVAVIEIKNYLDRAAAESGKKFLEKIKDGTNDESTKYALFSFNPIATKNIVELKTFSSDDNNFLIAKRSEDDKPYLQQRHEDCGVKDLSVFLEEIKDRVIL